MGLVYVFASFIKKGFLAGISGIQFPLLFYFNCSKLGFPSLIDTLASHLAFFNFKIHFFIEVTLN